MASCLRSAYYQAAKHSGHVGEFVMSYMTGTADDLEYPLLPASFGVPAWVLTSAFRLICSTWHGASNAPNTCTTGQVLLAGRPTGSVVTE